MSASLSNRNCRSGSCPEGNCQVGSCPGGNCQVGSCPEGSCRKSGNRAANEDQLAGLNLSDCDRGLLLSLELDARQFAQVLDRIKSTYLAEDDCDNADNLRLARKSRPAQVERYLAAAADGCCGSHDEEFEVVDDGGGQETVMLGYNFGH